MSEWNPADYHQHSAQQQQWAHEVLAKLALAGDESILDIGCGDGKVTARIAQAIPLGSAFVMVLLVPGSGQIVATLATGSFHRSTCTQRLRAGSPHATIVALA